MIEVGTRTRQISVSTRMPGGSETRSHSADIGMTKNVTASVSFAAQFVTGANGTFAAFALNDVVLFEDTNMNNGLFTVLGLDVANQAYLWLDPRPFPEGPITATCRTA